MSVNPGTVNTLVWQAEDVNSTVQNIIANTAYVQYCFAVNNDNAVRYLQFFNVAAADVIVGTTGSYWVAVPPLGMTVLDIPNGVFYNGPALSVAATTTPDGAVSVTNNMYLTIHYTRG